MPVKIQFFFIPKNKGMSCPLINSGGQSLMTSFTMLRNVVPRWFGKIFLPNQRGGFGNVNHCKTRANKLSQRKVSKVGKSSSTLSRIYL